MLNRINWPSEFVDCFCQRTGEVVNQRLGQCHLVAVGLVSLQRLWRHGIAQHGDYAYCGGSLQVAVVASCSQRVEESCCRRANFVAHFDEQLAAYAAALYRVFHHFAGSTQWPCKCIDCKRGFVTKQVANHHAQNKCNAWVDARHGKHNSGGLKTIFTFCGNDDWQCFVRAINRDLFCNVGRRAVLQTSGAHDDHWFARQVDVLFIFGDIAGDGFVTQLAQFDANFLGRHRVEPVANHRPVPA